MTSKQRIKVNLPTIQTDASAICHGHSFIVEGVTHIGQSSNVRVGVELDGAARSCNHGYGLQTYLIVAKAF